MEGLLFYILLVVTYIAYKLMVLFFPAIKRWAGLPAKRLKGKFYQSDFLIMPSDFDASRQLSYEVTELGMSTKLELICLADYDSLQSKKDFRQANLNLVRKEFFQNQFFGAYGVVAVKHKLGDVRVDLGLVCSPESFDLIVKELHEKRAILIRVLAHEVKGTDHLHAESFHILTEQSLSGPKYFVERYLEHLSKVKELDKEKFSAIKDKFKRAFEK